MNKYKEFKEQQQKEFNNFPIKFAFSDSQFEKAMQELGLTKNDTDKVTSIGVGGGFIRKSDVEAFNEMIERFDKEQKEHLTDLEFVTDMFLYELGNHEYGYTHDLDDTLEACDITVEDLENNEIFKKGLQLALAKYKEIDE